MGGRGSLRGDRPGRRLEAWNKGAGGLEQGGWGLGRVSNGLGAGAWRGPRGWGRGRGGTVWPQGTKGGSALTIFLPFPIEIGCSVNFSLKMALSYISEVSQIEFCSIAITREIKGKSFVR